MGEIKTTVKDIVGSLIEKYEKPIDPIKFNIELKEISKLLTDKYYLLICPDLRQYVFIDIINHDIDKIYETLYEILINRGQVVVLDRDNEKQMIWEFWIKDKFDNKLYFYQLCNYTSSTVII